MICMVGGCFKRCLCLVVDLVHPKLNFFIRYKPKWVTPAFDRITSTDHLPYWFEEYLLEEGMETYYESGEELFL